MVTSGKERRIVAHLGRDLRRFVEGDGVGHGRAHPQRAFVQMRHEFGADDGNEQQRQRPAQRPRRWSSRQGCARQKSRPLCRRDLMASNAALRRSRTPSRMNQAHSTGSRVSVTISEPTSANTMVSAIGLNRSPGRPGQDIDRQKADHDHRHGIEERPVHFRRRILDDLDNIEAACPGAAAIWRKIFSTMNTAPSTRMPKSTAPMESRLAEAFCRSRQMKANSSASGMVTATISPARKS